MLPYAPPRLITLGIAAWPAAALVAAPPAGERGRSVIVTEIIGYTESGDSLIFRAGSDQFYVYAHGEQGEKAEALVRHSLEAKKAICLHLNAKIKGLVDRITSSC